jgi:hypothetical protein
LQLIIVALNLQVLVALKGSHRKLLVEMKRSIRVSLIALKGSHWKLCVSNVTAEFDGESK